MSMHHDCFRCGKTLSPAQQVRWPLGASVVRCLDCVLQFARDEHQVDISTDLLRRLAVDLFYDDAATRVPLRPPAAVGD